jgi:2-oxo-4-hydroxy-4-carboxy-5-ureidoimidazoline decarboxylase
VDPVLVAEFDSAATADAAAELIPCCVNRHWVGYLVKNRPYRTLSGLAAASDEALAGLPWTEVLDAAAAQPMLTAPTCLDDDFLRMAANRYQARFGHAFLICAVGLTTQDLASALRSRLANDPVAERRVIRAELAKIVRLNLAGCFR